MRGHRRRTVLGAAAGVALLSGCGIFDDDEQPQPADPLRPVLDEALTLAAAYDRAAAAQPGLARRLAPLAADHRAHAGELARITGTTLPSAPAAAASGAANAPGTVAELRKAEQAAQQTAVAACLAAPADRAPLVASIAASRATHAEALR
jgi:hypothetical protein